ncbi:hypothetical protein P3X46_024737 [Hevea brasiliensis]|uniref:C2H2-type domain-containing protein n=1 Tax=Hevea brasiliensis TaxID=3981 RepID=A0ABQ9L4Y1_HEVBR|nr:hypothetical protein P3X46_024737 [Hevea brasiliensis]
MGVAGLFVKFAVDCFATLAWPLIALGYPLCTSIQAIETNSNSDTQKLITYWVCFSVILLFEHAFLKLLLWLPWWSYIKLVIVGCLVTPHFDGSFYVYKHIVHPCLSMDLHIVINRLIMLKEFFKQDNLLIEVERDAKETEAEALENIIAFKLQVREMKPGLTLAGNRPSAYLLNVLPSNNIQKEWTCALCQVTTTCEANLISHLHGRRHEDACEKLNGLNQTLKIKLSPASVETGRLPEIKEMAKAMVAECRDNLPDKPEPKTTHEPWTCALCNVTTTTKADLVSHFQGRRHKDALEKPKAIIQISKVKIFPSLAETGAPSENREMTITALAGRNLHNMPWTCGVCRAKITNEMNLISHLQGRRHEDACENYKANKQTTYSLWCRICNMSCSSEGNMKAHLSGKMHLARTQLNNVGWRLEI